MLDMKLLEKRAGEGPSFLDEYRANLVHRGARTETLDQLLELNRQRKELITRSEQAKAHQKKVSAQIPELKRSGKDASQLLAETATLAQDVKTLERQAAEIDERVFQLALTLPNRTHGTVPVGKSADDNAVEKKVGEPRTFSFQAKEHFILGEKLGIFDFERATKVAGARFTFLKGFAARLERALIQFFMDLHSSQHGYMEMIPPFFVNSASMVGTGQFPKFFDDAFHVTGTDYHLIPTAEVPVTNYFRDEILEEEQLPLKFCAFSPCFRAEAGAAGRDTRGITRQHQFQKVELMVFAHPERSYELHEELTCHAEQCLVELELPFRRLNLCTADIGFAAAKTYDLEVWLPGAGVYREISSCSNFEDFQARRANIRYRSKGGKPQFVHTLNGSGLAIGRTIIALLENYQQEDGSVRVPRSLQKYMGGVDVIR
ncbi:MAG: serine--tRNA ligase [Bdellovibrio sp.]|nr:MAG: serine--tRNA ligase [Bdellovibrio sp.]